MHLLLVFSPGNANVGVKGLCPHKAQTLCFFILLLLMRYGTSEICFLIHTGGAVLELYREKKNGTVATKPEDVISLQVCTILWCLWFRSSNFAGLSSADLDFILLHCMQMYFEINLKRPVQILFNLLVLVNGKDPFSVYSGQFKESCRL